MSVIDEIKARLDLVAYISETVPLKKAGRSYKARCPFHQERTPSFVVFPETQHWHCFGACGEGGDIITFAMKQHGWDFNEALAHLAERAGVELRPRTAEQEQQDAVFDRMLGLLEETARYYHTLLQEAPEAEVARAYLVRRGLNAQTIADFRLGYAPDDWHATLRHLEGLGYSAADVVAAGVAIRNEEGRVYDRFRHRLMIPIRDGRGRVIGFGARALRDEDTPKYLNSPQSELFDKSATLFGLDLARREIRETETAIIVEGYMDVMQAHQAGFRNVVAQMGTALTDTQLQTLRRYADRLILALDADEAGVSATMRGLDVARQVLNEASATLFGPDGSLRRAGRLGIDMRVIVITSGKDPDDLIRENPREWQRLVAEAEPVADYVIRVGTAGLDIAHATIHEKEKIARQLLPLLTATESDLHREVNVQKLAYRLHLPEKRLMEIALESRMVTARPRLANPRLRERRPTRAMEQAARQYRRPEAPPVPPAPDAAWEEGPRPEPDALLPPDEDESEPPAEGQPLEAPPVARVAPGPASLQEQYVLNLLLRRPSLLYQANRALRQVADSLQGRFPDENRMTRLRQALGSLRSEDFRDTTCQAIFEALQAALRQDDLDPQVFIQNTLGDLFAEPLQRLRALRDPVAGRLPGLEQELYSIQKEMRRQGRNLHEPESEMIDKVFTLRRDRLRQTIDALRFVVLEAEDEERQAYQDAIDASQAAVAALDRALQERAELPNG